MGGSSSPLPNPVKKVVNAVADTVVNVVKNPLPVIETVVLTSAGLPPDASSAVVTYANGGSLKDAAISYGAVNVGQAASEYVSPAAQAPDNIDVGGGYNPATGAGDPTTAIAAAAGQAPVTSSAAKGAAKSATQTALSGGSAKDIISSGLKGGVVGGGTEYIAEQAGTQPGTTSDFLVRTLAGGTLSNIVSGSKSTPYVPTGSAPPTSVTTTGAGAAPGTAALAQALRTDLGAPIFGGDKDKESPKSGWNVESLRYMGNSGEA